MSDLVFNLTYNPEGKAYVMPGRERKDGMYDFTPLEEAAMVAEDHAPFGG